MVAIISQRNKEKPALFGKRKGNVKMVGSAGVPNGIKPHNFERTAKQDVPDFIPPNGSQVDSMHVPGFLGVMQRSLVERQPHCRIIFGLALNVGDHQIIIGQGGGGYRYPQNRVHRSVHLADVITFGINGREVHHPIKTESKNERPNTAQAEFQQHFFILNPPEQKEDVKEKQQYRNKNPTAQGQPAVPAVREIQQNRGSDKQKKWKDNQTDDHQKPEYNTEAGVLLFWG